MTEEDAIDVVAEKDDVKVDVSDDNGAAKFVCNLKGCEEKFNDERAFRIHVTYVHGIAPLVKMIRGKQYNCFYCPVSFGAIKEYREHLESKHSVSYFIVRFWKYNWFF